MVDIEVGSSPESWGNLSACTALARTLTEAFAVTHILANQWLVSEGYETETGIEAIFIHDKLKGCYKDLARNLAEKYDVPVYKHQKLRAPETLEWK